MQGLGMAWLPEFAIEKELQEEKLSIITGFDAINNLSVSLYRIPSSDHTKSIYWQGITQALENDDLN